MLVVDASAIGALVREQQAETVAAQLGASPGGPALVWFELASIALKIKAYPAERLQILRALTLGCPWRSGRRGRPPGNHRTVGSTPHHTDDASYLWLAQELGGELVTRSTKNSTEVVAGKF